MESSTNTPEPTSSPLSTAGPRASKFTELVADNDLTPISSHDYDCALDSAGGDCEHITLDGIDPTFPDTWDLMPMTLSSAVWSASPSLSDASDNDEEGGVQMGDSALQIDSEEARHADAMAKFGARTRRRSWPQVRRRSWGGVRVLVNALRKRIRVLEGRMRRGSGLRGVHEDVVC